MKNSTSHQLAIFGKNRYHDWVLFFSIAIGVMVIALAYNVFLYMSTKSQIDASSEVIVVPSQFERFKKDVDFLSSYIEGKKGTTTIAIPMDPSIR